MMLKKRQIDPIGLSHWRSVAFDQHLSSHLSSLVATAFLPASPSQVDGITCEWEQGDLFLYDRLFCLHTMPYKLISVVANGISFLFEAEW